MIKLGRDQALIDMIIQLSSALLEIFDILYI